MVTVSNYDSLSTSSGDNMSEELDIKSVVEATFGPGAFELLDDEHDVEPGVHEPATMNEDSQDVVDDVARGSQPETMTTSHPSQRLVFEISETCFAVPVANIVEVQHLPKVTWMPRVPAWVRGVVSLRGKVISVCDLSMFLELSSVPADSGQRMIVVRSLADTINTALIVDTVIGIRDIGTDARGESVPADTVANCVRATVECNGRSVCLVDLEEMLLSDKMRQLQAH